MLVHRITTPCKQLLALVVLLGLAAVACGSSVTEAPPELSSSESSRTVPATGSSDESATVEQVTVSGSGHSYGTSIEDWGTAAEGSEAVTDADGSLEPTLRVVQENEPAKPRRSVSPGFDVIAWADLIPAGMSGAEITARYADRLDAVEYGTDEATSLYEEMRAEYLDDAVNLSLDGQKIRLAGFVAPLAYDGEFVTEFLLVPTFGACIHVPPPPPNQTVMVTLAKADGLTLEEAWGPVWVEGTLVIAPATTDLAEASYTLAQAVSGVYDDF